MTNSQAAPSTTVPLPDLHPSRGMLGRELGTWGFYAVLCAALFLPLYFFQNDTYWLPLFTRYMALAIFAIRSTW